MASGVAESVVSGPVRPRAGVGGTPSHRTTLDREEGRRRAAELSLAGVGQHAIAAELGVSQSQVSLDLTASRRQWTAAMVTDLDAVMRAELARLDELEARAMQGYEASRTTKRTTKIRAEKVTKNGTATMAPVGQEVVDEEQAGDPRFLAVAAQCVRQRAKLLGLETSAVVSARFSVTHRLDVGMPAGPEARAQHTVAYLRQAIGDGSITPEMAGQIIAELGDDGKLIEAQSVEGSPPGGDDGDSRNR